MIYFLLFFSFHSFAEPTVLEGKWVQNCKNGMVREELFTNDHVTLTERGFEDSLCSSPAFEFINEGSFVLGGALRQPVRAKAIDFTFEGVFALVHLPNMVAKFNEMSMCGFNDWNLGEKKEITGFACAFFGANSLVPSKGEQRFGIYRVERNYLFFGQLTPDNDAKTPERRPVEYNPFGFVKSSF